MRGVRQETGRPTRAQAWWPRACWRQPFRGNGALVWDTRTSAPHHGCLSTTRPHFSVDGHSRHKGKPQAGKGGCREGPPSGDAWPGLDLGFSTREAGPDPLPADMGAGVGVEGRRKAQAVCSVSMAAGGDEGETRCDITEAFLTPARGNAAHKSTVRAAPFLQFVPGLSLIPPG